MFACSSRFFSTTALLGVLLLASPLCAVESVLSFNSRIEVHQNASMSVREDIHVMAEGKQIKRGIVREFPTTYWDKTGRRIRVGFEIEKVELDGKPCPYFIENRSNGININFGTDAFISKGPHTYTLKYKTTRQLGFFDDHDELYWNVTGNGWRLPIIKASAQVILPQGIDPAAIRITAFTGKYGSTEKKYHAYIENNIAHFTTIGGLATLEGLTIACAWPKGFVTPPSFYQKLQWFFLDNFHVGVILLAWMAIILYGRSLQRKINEDDSHSVIIPLFHPPKDLLPGEMRYIINKGYDSNVMTADLVHLAVEGCLTFEEEPGGFFKRKTILLKKTEQETSVPYYKRLLRLLFPTGKALSLGSSRNVQVEAAVKLTKKNYSSWKAYFNPFIPRFITGAALITIPAFALIIFMGAAPLFILVLLSPSIYYLKKLESYSPKAQKVVAEIEGFKLFLGVSEANRIRLTGTPPAKTPKLFEKYLPFAIALGVEKQWTEQFKSTFSELEAKGQPYTCSWYTGKGYFNAAYVSDHVGSSLNSAISSSSAAPGSRSGFSGGSSSGGGGGGGGGGGR